MRLPSIHRGVLYTTLSAMIIGFGTLVAIQYAKGNLRITRDGFLPESGLLAANSFPSGAEVKINDRLVSATDDTLYLEPGEYDVSIEKEGYAPWQKNLTVQEELVTQTNAELFRKAPSLVPLSFNDARNVLPAPDGSKIVFYSDSAASAARTGLYLLELNNGILSLNREVTQIASDSDGAFAFDAAQLIWSPDSSELLVISPDKTVLLDTNRKNDVATQEDVSFQQARILSEWEEEMYLRERQFLGEFPEEMIAIATRSASNVYISPDKKRLLYTATASAVIPEGLEPDIPAESTQPETRTLESGGVYVYDREEDKNFQVGFDDTTRTDIENTAVLSATSIPTTESATVSAQSVQKRLLATDLFSDQPLTLEASPSAFTTLQATESARTAARFRAYHSPLYNPSNFQWYPNSKHLLYTTPDEIRIKEYDNANDTVLFAGPFQNRFVYPWPDGSKLVILTSLRPDAGRSFYAVEIK